MWFVGNIKYFIVIIHYLIEIYQQSTIIRRYFTELNFFLIFDIYIDSASSAIFNLEYSFFSFFSITHLT